MHSIIVLLLICTKYLHGAKILMASMPQGRSHTGSYMALLNKLKENGHQVFLYMEAYPDETTFGLEDRMLRIKNYTNPFRDGDFEFLQWNYDFVVTSQMIPFFRGSISCENVLKDFRGYFFQMVNEKYDLILTDSLFAVCAYGFTTLNQANHVLMSSTDIESATGSMRAHGINFALLPRHFMPVQDAVFKPEIFRYRLSGTIEWIANFIISGIIVGERMKIALAPVLPTFSFFEYQRTASSTLTDMPTDLIGPYPRTNDLLDYGAYCQASTPLTGKLLEFVSDPNSKGTILVAFGTVINWKFAPKEKFRAVIDALNSLSEYRIVWAYNGDKINVEPHIFASKWIPQLDVLHHERTVLFIGHGGLKSVKEATCASVPSIFMPMFAEQVRNSWMAMSKGYAEILSKHDLTAESLKAAIKRVLENKSFSANAARVTMFFNDKVVHPLSLGVHYINRLLKYGGRMPEFFYPRAITRDYVTYLNLDIFVIPFLVVLLLAC